MCQLRAIRRGNFLLVVCEIAQLHHFLRNVVIKTAAKNYSRCSRKHGENFQYKLLVHVIASFCNLSQIISALIVKNIFYNSRNYGYCKRTDDFSHNQIIPFIFLFLMIFCCMRMFFAKIRIQKFGEKYIPISPQSTVIWGFIIFLRLYNIYLKFVILRIIATNC